MVDLVLRRLSDTGYDHIPVLDIANDHCSFDYSMVNGDGNIKVKRMTVFAIDLRLCRVGLSRMDVTKTVREQQSLLNMLANAFAEDVQTALEAGMTAHVAKPIDLDVLKTTLKNALL